MIHRFDEAALEALSSKGLLRRARRDLESGAGKIEAMDDAKATVTIDDLSVELNAKGPEASSCTCKAHGVCRHILHAVLLLRAQPDEAEDANECEDVQSAVTDICALTDEQVAKFAGADWDKAILLADDDLGVAFENEGVNITVRLVSMDASVTFIAGGGLKGAAYKGLKTKKRLLSTLAALLVRKREGRELPAGASGLAVSQSLDHGFIDLAQQTLERAVSAALPGRSLLGRDLLLDLAISTRCEALPRLSAELRALAKQAQLAHERSIDFEPDSFLLDVSRAYALLEALRSQPVDAQLGGSVRRRYEPQAAIEVWPLGVARWRSDTGARGLSAYVLDPANSRWLTVLEGRSSGTDLSFDVANAYQAPVWGAAALSGLMGRRVRLSEPRITHDNLISSNDQAGSQLLKVSLKPGEVLASTTTHKNWQRLRQDLEHRIGVGIRRRTTPIPALIAPTRFGQLGFDDMSQCYHFEVMDEQGATLVLEMPGDDDQSALRLWKLGRSIAALTVEARLDAGRLVIRPVAVLQKRRDELTVHNVDFDRWSVESGWSKAIARMRETVAKPLVIDQRGSDQLVQILADTSDCIVAIASGSVAQGLASIERRLDATGLTALRRVLHEASESMDVRAVLRAAYVTSELRFVCTLR